MTAADHQVGPTPAPGREATVVAGRGDLADRAVDHLAALAAQAADLPTVVIQLIDGTGLRLAGAVGLPTRWSVMPVVPLDSTLAGVVLTGGFPIVVSDVLHDARIPPDAPLRSVGGRAFLGFPVRDQDDVAVGVCSAIDYRPRVWTADEMRAVDHAAQACGILVGKQRARQEADRQRVLVDAILDNLNVAVIACDAQGRVTRLNRAVRTLGEPPPGGLLLDWVGQLGVYTPTGEPMAHEDLPLVRALRGETVHGVDLVVHGRDGRRRTVTCDAQPLVGPAGECAGAVLALQDVTAQRRTARFRDCELAVAAALAEAGTAEEAGPPVLAAVAGCLGWPYAELWLVDDAGDALRPVARWHAPGAAEVPAPERLRRGVGLAGAAWRDGLPLWIHDLSRAPGVSAPTGGVRAALAVPVRSGSSVLGVLAFFADMVADPEDGMVALLSGIAAHIGQFLERRRAEELERQLIRSKDDYVALVGHELRTPLTSISAGIELLKDLPDGVLAAEAPQLLEIVDRNALALRRVVDDLLDLAALDAGQVTFRPTLFDLADLVREAADDLEPTVAAAELELVVEVPDEVLVEGDRVRLRQVVDNLLDNAVKFTGPAGRVEVRLRRDGYLAELTVCDTGIGIPAEDREQLFVHMYRSPYARDRRIAGSGLGLVICRTILERHGGTIALAPRDEPGTCVIARLRTVPNRGVSQPDSISSAGQAGTEHSPEEVD